MRSEQGDTEFTLHFLWLVWQHILWGARVHAVPPNWGWPTAVEPLGTTHPHPRNCLAVYKNMHGYNVFPSSFRHKKYSR